MIAYYRPKQELEDVEQPQAQRSALSRDLFHGLTPEQFDVEAKSLAKVQAMTPAVRARMKSQLIERLKTPVDDAELGSGLGQARREGRGPPPQEARRGGQAAALRPQGRRSRKTRTSRSTIASAPTPTSSRATWRRAARSRITARSIMAAVVLALGIALLAMFVDYHIIRGEVWTRALSNEFMVVPPACRARSSSRACRSSSPC